MLFCMMAEEITCKLPLLDCNSHCILKSRWSCYDIEFKLYFNGNAWTGQLNERDITQFCNLLSMTVDDYMSNTKSALSCHGGEKQFTYTIDKDMFSWTKCIGAEMGIKFGYVVLNPAPVLEIMNNIVDSSVDLNAEFSKMIKDLQLENGKLSSKYQELSTLLEKEISSKQEMESGLYCQFLSILNRKKERILELEKQLHLREEGSDGLSSTGNSPIHDSMNHYDSDTEPNSDGESTDILSQKGSSSAQNQSSGFKSNDLFNLPPRRPKRSGNTSCLEDKSGQSGMNL